MVLIVAMVYLAMALSVNSQMSQFIPLGGDNRSQLRASLLSSELQQGETAKLLLIAAQGDNVTELVNFSQQLKAAMLHSGLFDVVRNGQQHRDESSFELLIRYRYLLDPTLDQSGFSAQALRRALQQRLMELRSGLGLVLKKNLQTDPTASFFSYLASLNHTTGITSGQGVWMLADDRTAVLMAKMHLDGFDLDSQQRAMDFVGQQAARLSPDGKINLILTGPGTFAVASREQIRTATQRLSMVSAGLLVVLFWLAYRSLRLLLFVVLPLGSAVVVAMAVTNIVFGEIHGITLAFGVTLLAVCIDYPIHFFSHLHQSQTPRDAINHVWPVIRLGVMTTCLGYLALLGTAFVGLSQMAVFAIAGLLSAAWVTHRVLPWLVKPADLKVSTQWLVPVLSLTRLAAPLRVGILAVLLAISSYPWVWHEQPLWQQDISALSPVPAKAIARDRELRQALALPDVNHLFVFSANDEQSALRLTEQAFTELQSLRQSNIVGAISAVTQLLPSQQVQRQRQRKLPSETTLRSALANAQQGLPFKQGTFEPFIKAVRQSQQLVPLDWSAFSHSPLRGYVENNFFRRNHHWISVIRLSDVKDEARLTDWLSQHVVLARDYINMRQQTSAMMASYRNQAKERLLWGGLLMLLVLYIAFKKWSTTFRVLLPALLGVMLSLALQLFSGVQLGLFHLLAVLLVVGIGIDYGLFFNHVEPADGSSLLQRLHGVSISALTTVIGFGLLIFSGIPVLVAIGQTVTLGVAACFVMALLLADSVQIGQSHKHG